MIKYHLFQVVIVLLAVTGCASQSPFLINKQPMATETILKQARLEMNCPEATATIISEEVVQPSLRRPWVNGIQRAEFTVGVSGCGNRHTYMVICPDNSEGCYVAGPGPFHSGF